MDQKQFRKILSTEGRASINFNDWYKEVQHFVSQNIMQPINIPAFQKLVYLLKANPFPDRVELEDRLALLFGDQDLLEYYYNAKNSKTKTFIEELTWNGSVSYQDAKAIFGEDLVTLSRRERYGLAPLAPYKQWHHLLNCSHYSYYQQENLELKMSDSEFYYVMPEFMRMGYAQILPKPKGYYLKEIKIPKKWQIYQTEATLFEELPAILSYIQQDKIKRTTKGFLNLASIKSMQKKLNLQTFPNDPGHIKSLLINGMMDRFLRIAPSDSVIKILRFLFLEQDMMDSMLEAALFPLTNVRKMDAYDLYPDTLKTTFQILQTLPVGVWISYQNIQQYAATNLFGLKPVDNLYEIALMDTSVHYTDFYNSGYEGKMAITKQILVTGALLMAAAYGLIDLAYDPDDPQVNLAVYPNYQDVLFSACRLTPLGAHIMQDSKEYVAPVKSGIPAFTLDERSFQIQYSGNPNLAAGLLDTWTYKSPEGHLSFDLAKVLKNNNSAALFKASIEKFKKSIATPLPDYWNQQFQEVLTRSADLRSVTNLLVFRISPKATALHQLIAKDEILRKLIIKAEQYTIIVDATNKQAFNNRLATLGYLPGLDKIYALEHSEF